MLRKKFFLTSVFFFIAASLILFVVDEKAYKFFAKLVLFASLVVPVTAVIMHNTIGASKSKALLANALFLCVTVAFVFVTAEFS